MCSHSNCTRSYIYIYSLYIQPTASIDVYRLHIEAIEHLSKGLLATDSIFVMGDFNLGGSTIWHENDSGFDFIPMIGDSQSAKSIIAREVTARLLDCGLFQISNQKNVSGNVLDLVYTNVPELTDLDRAELLLLPSFKSDPHHVPIRCLIDCSPTIANNMDAQSVYCFKRANYELIREHLENIDFQNMFVHASDNVNELTSKLYGILNDTFVNFIPSTLIRSNNKPRWHDKQLASLKNKRNKTFKIFSHRRNELVENLHIYEEAFLVAREEYEAYLKLRFSNYLRAQTNNLKTDPKSFWRLINNKRVSNQIPSVVKLGNQTASTDKDKTSLFADFFQSVYSIHNNDEFDIHEFIANRNETNCHIINATPESVYAVLSTLDQNKGSGYDGISPIFLRECAEFLAEPLSMIFNKSLIDGSYPELFKIGQITPIHKKGSKANIENYRGVNVLPGLAKVFEKVIYKQLKLIVPPRISSCQHGFISNRNIETNLMEITTLAHRAFENKSQLDIFYSDIEKAFDTVNPIKLIQKAAKFKVSNAFILWLYSYLHDRKQYVKIGQSTSEFFNVASGVGQGTILGPLLFIIFFDDSNIKIPGVVNSNFADDKKCALEIRNQSDAAKLQTAIDQFQEWCKANDLSIHYMKCKILSLYTKKNPIVYNYTINGQPIERVNEMRDLGVIFDRKLNFNSHIEYICNKAKAALQFVRRQSFYFEKDIIKILYMALVRSNLEFASLIWSPYHVTQKKLVESAQKQIVMLLNGDYRRQLEGNYVLRPYVERCKDLELTTLIRRRVNASVLFIHSIIIGKYNAPQLLSQMNLNKGLRTLRNPEFIRMKRCSTDHSTMAPFNNACRMFNYAALFIDPTLPHHQFRQKLIHLPDESFGPWLIL